MTTAFQLNAFQDNAFQIDDLVVVDDDDGIPTVGGSLHWAAGFRRKKVADDEPDPREAEIENNAAALLLVS